MPAQTVDLTGALRDQVRAVIGQETDLKRPLIKERRGEALHALSDHGASDSPGVDLIGLARLALPAPGFAHHLRRNPNDPLTRSYQSLLKTPREMPAVLDRPH